MKVRFCLMLSAALAASAAQGANEGQIGTCYDKKLAAAAPASDAEIFVLIDQTTALDGGLKQSVADNMRPFLSAGHRYTVSTFSAFTQGRYASVIGSGTLDAPLDADKRNAVSKPLLAKFDQCMAAQPRLAMQHVGSALRSAFDGTSTSIAKSDVLASLKAMSARIKESPAARKTVLIVSDMLENSSISSFYADRGNAVRRIDPAQELKLAADNHLLADFGGADVYVMGAGVLGDAAGKSKSKSYRDPKTMQALAGFWKTYFEKSNARLVEFGQPALLNPVK